MSSGQYKIRRRLPSGHDGPTVSDREKLGLRAPSSAHLSEIRGSPMSKAGAACVPSDYHSPVMSSEQYKIRHDEPAVFGRESSAYVRPLRRTSATSATLS